MAKADEELSKFILNQSVGGEKKICIRSVRAGAKGSGSG
jgi:hypothetical protein